MLATVVVAECRLSGLRLGCAWHAVPAASYSVFTGDLLHAVAQQDAAGVHGGLLGAGACRQVHHVACMTFCGSACNACCCMVCLPAAGGRDVCACCLHRLSVACIQATFA